MQIAAHFAAAERSLTIQGERVPALDASERVFERHEHAMHNARSADTARTTAKNCLKTTGNTKEQNG